MDSYFEYTVPAKATKNECYIRLGLWIAAVVCAVLCFFWWWFVFGSVAFLAAAIWYGNQLNYEYEYEFCEDELTISRIINKSSRKQAADLQLKEMELFTNDYANIKPILQNGGRLVQMALPDNVNGYIVMNGKEGKIVYGLELTEQAVRTIRRKFPQKTKWIMH